MLGMTAVQWGVVKPNEKNEPIMLYTSLAVGMDVE